MSNMKVDAKVISEAGNRYAATIGSLYAMRDNPSDQAFKNLMEHIKMMHESEIEFISLALASKEILVPEVRK